MTTKEVLQMMNKEKLSHHRKLKNVRFKDNQNTCNINLNQGLTLNMNRVLLKVRVLKMKFRSLST